MVRKTSAVLALGVLACIAWTAMAAPGDALIAVGGTVVRYDATTKTTGPAVLTGLGTEVYDMVALSDGNALVASDGMSGKVMLYDAATNASGGMKMSYAGVVGPMAALADGDALVPIANGGQVWVYDGATAAASLAGGGMGDAFMDVVVLPNGDALIASNGMGGKLSRYDGTAGTTSPLPSSYMGDIKMDVLGSGDAFGAYSAGGGAFRYDAAAASLTWIAVGLGDAIYDVVGLPNGDALIASNGAGGKLSRYDGTAVTVPTSWGSYMGDIKMDVLTDGNVLGAYSAGGGAFLYDAATPGVTWYAAGLGNAIYDVAALPNGDALIASNGGGGKISLYDNAAGTVTQVGILGSPIVDVLALPDGDALIFVDDGTGTLYRYDGAAEALAGSVGTVMGTAYGDMIVLLGGAGALIGDMDGSGAVNNNDISPFVMALTDRATYIATYGLDPDVVGDIDGSGQLNNNDITPFVDLLTGAPQAVPEPMMTVLLGLGGTVLLRRPARRCVRASRLT